MGRVKVGFEAFFVVSVAFEGEASTEDGGIGVGVGFGEDTGSMKIEGGTGVVAGSSVIARNKEVNSQVLLRDLEMAEMTAYVRKEGLFIHTRELTPNKQEVMNSPLNLGICATLQLSEMESRRLESSLPCS